MKSLILPLIVFAITFGIHSSASALKSDRDQPAQIEADETEIDFRTGTRILTSNVLIVQGTLRVKADKLVANYNKEGDLIKAIADGSLARFKQRPDNQPNDVEGWAKKIEIHYPTNTVTLIGKAALKQSGTTARGNKIVYNMATDKLKIMGGTDINSAGKNGSSKPKKKLKDPFAGDEQGPSKADPIDSKWNTKKANSDGSKNDVDDADTEQQENTTPEPPKAGRSRLILQPRKKVKKKEPEETIEESKEKSAK